MQRGGCSESLLRLRLARADASMQLHVKVNTGKGWVAG